MTPITKPVREYLTAQLQDPEFAAAWAMLIEDDPIEYLHRLLQETGEMESLSSEDTEYIQE